MHHLANVDLICRDDEVARLYIIDKLQRQASHELFRALISTITDCMGEQYIRRMSLPNSIFINPLDKNVQRIWDDHAQAAYVVMPNQDVHRVLPDHFSIKNLEISTHITDRCSINVAMMNWAQSSAGILWHAIYGMHHDLWSTEKSAIKRCSTNN